MHHMTIRKCGRSRIKMKDQLHLTISCYYSSLPDAVVGTVGPRQYNSAARSRLKIWRQQHRTHHVRSISLAAFLLVLKLDNLVLFNR